MPRLIRRRPVLERIKAYLDPLDFLLWLSEELESSDWEQWQKEWATPIGIALNVVFLVARANSGPASRTREDDVFGDDVLLYTGWLAWFAAFLVHFLSLLSFANAAYTFYRQRHYRLFETSVNAVPSAPSASRVRVDSSPLSSSPLRFLSRLLEVDNAESRSYPDATRDVWELAVWDPTPLALRMFCLFSPGHVLVYWLFLPTAISDPRPSTTVATTTVLASLLSAQLMMLQKSFSQQSKDTSVIHKEVLNEYDTKYVHPRTQPHMRDVGTQYSSSGTSTHEADENGVDTYSPVVILQRTFQTRPNPNYLKHVDPEGYTRCATSPPKSTSTSMPPPLQTPAHLRDASSPIRPRNPIRQPEFGPPTGDGGSLGIYSHANSPLRKAASTNVAEAYRQSERGLSPAKRVGSPLKRSSVPGERLNGNRFPHLQGTPARKESGRF